MSILKIEAFSGLSGDMFLGALAELTGAYEEIKKLPELLLLENVEVKITDVEKAGIACKHIKIIDHNDYGEHKNIHHHSSLPGEKPAQFSLQQKKPHHHHRHLSDIEKIIQKGNISAKAKEIASDIFYILGTAEAKVHGVDIRTIHFHEVGAIDSILDIVGTAYLLEKLNIDETVSTPICTGHGFVKADHGRMPIPAPATKELLLNVPSYAGTERGEMTTPTGAAILKYLRPSFEIPPLIEQKIGHGPGEKSFEHPNVLRLTLCHPIGDEKEEIYMAETNIDDLSAELLGNNFQDKLMQSGALDYYYTHVQMKKGRPGLLITVFTQKKNIRSVSEFLLENTSTIGVRIYPVQRAVLKRTIKTIHTSLGEAEVKETVLPSGKTRVTLEYESIKKIADKSNLPIIEVFKILNKEI
jgi:pyridinium-3,5-bisthiocarboxylic acid mononucleotide nickel chelatase